MTSFQSTNAHPVSPIPSPHSIPTKVALWGSNSTSVANTTFLFQPLIVTFSVLQKTTPSHRFIQILPTTCHPSSRPPTTLRIRPPASFDELEWSILIVCEDWIDHFEGSALPAQPFILRWAISISLVGKITHTHPRSFEVNNSVLCSTVNLFTNQLRRKLCMGRRALDAVAFRLESANEWRIRQNATIHCWWGWLGEKMRLLGGVDTIVVRGIVGFETARVTIRKQTLAWKYNLCPH